MQAGRARDRDLVEVRSLHQHVRRGVADLGRRPTHDPGQAEHAAAGSCGRVGDQQVLGVQGTVDVVERREALARRGPAHHDRRRDLGQVVRVERLPEVEHHVVRDVDRQRDGPHAGALEAVLHPGRRGRGRVDAAHDPRHEPVTARHAVDRRVVPHLHLEAVRRGRRLGAGGQAVVGELGARGVRVLARHAAVAERVPTVGGHVDLQDLLPEAEERDRVLAGGEVLGGEPVAGQHQDAVVVVADPELADRADHAVGHVPVGLASSDGERTGQDRAGQRDRDEVADAEVVRAADDAARALLVVVLGAHVDPAPVDGLAVLLRLGGHLEHAAHDEGAGDGGRMDRLLLQTHLHEVGRELLGGQVGGQVDVVGEPVLHDERHFRSPSRTGWRSARRPPRCRACPRSSGAA